MKKTILINTVLVALAAMTITSCISWKKMTLSDEAFLSDELFCKTPIVRAEINFLIDSANFITGWTDPEPYDFQPFVDYLCHCRVRQVPISIAPSTLVKVKLYDSNNNEYNLVFTTNGYIINIEGRIYEFSAEDACEIKKLLEQAKQNIGHSGGK